MSKPDKSSPWLPAEYEIADAAALQALERGEANDEQQRRALKWIIERACGTYDMSFRPGPDGSRNTDFAEGKRYVGLTLVKMLKINLSLLRRKENVS